MSGLEILIGRILEARGLQEAERQDIARSAISEVFEDDYLQAIDLIGLEAGVLRYLAQAMDIKVALMDLIGDRRVVIALANELNGRLDYSYCSLETSASPAMDKLLATEELRIIQPHHRFQGRVNLESFLAQARR